MAVPWYGGQVSKSSINPQGGATGKDFGALYGQNPYEDIYQKSMSILNGPLFGEGGLGVGFGGGSGFGNLQDHLANLLSGQRQQLRDYVRETASAGIPRGGYSVRYATGQNPKSEAYLQKQATDALAGGYESRYKTAAELADMDRQYLFKMLQERAAQLQAAAQVAQLRGDWQKQMGDVQAAAYDEDLAQPSYAEQQLAAWKAHQERMAGLQKQGILEEQLQKTMNPQDVSLAEMTGPSGIQAVYGAYPQQLNDLLASLFKGLA